jgi:hypothetical protein
MNSLVLPYLFIYLFVVLGFELRASYSLHQHFFVMGFFEIGSQELSAWAGFEPRALWSLPPE